MNTIHGYKDLIVWQKAMDLVEEIYNLVKLLPRNETYALSDQMRRAAISIPSNIAEGRSRPGNKDFIHFLNMALGSTYELQTQLLICQRLNYLPADSIETAFSISVEIGKIINTLTRKINENPSA